MKYYIKITSITKELGDLKKKKKKNKKRKGIKRTKYRSSRETLVSKFGKKELQFYRSKTDTSANVQLRLSSSLVAMVAAFISIALK